MAFAGTLGFAPLTTLARLSYDAGTDPKTLVLSRYIIASLALWLILQLSGRTPALPRKAWANALGTGVCWIAGTYGYLGAVAYIPVGLAAVLIYCFPLIVAALAPFTEKAHLSRLHALAFLAAFAGLALAIGPEFDRLDWRGIALALAGALGTAGTLLLTGRLAQDIDGQAHNFWVNVIGIIGLGILVATQGGPQLPGTDKGWWAFAAVMVLYVLAIVFILGGAKLAGAARTAMIMNLEPILTLILASYVLHEAFGTEQLGGAALVIGAVLLVGWLELRRGEAKKLAKQHNKDLLGLVLAFAAAIVYASITSFAAFAYGDGGNPETLLILRFFITAGVLGIAGLMAGKSFFVTGGARLAIIGGGIGLFCMSTGYMTSVAYIPVALAALVFYVFPLLVATSEAIVDKKPIGWVKGLAYVMAFAGLALALLVGEEIDTLDWRGLAFAGGGALAAVLMFLSTRRLTRAVDSQIATFYLAAVAAALSLVLIQFRGTIAFPDTLAGLGALAGACACFLVGMLLHVAAIKVAGPAKTAMILNFEPALTVLIAAFFLGEILSLPQWAGVVLVLTALAIASWPKSAED